MCALLAWHVPTKVELTWNWRNLKRKKAPKNCNLGKRDYLSCVTFNVMFSISLARASKCNWFAVKQEPYLDSSIQSNCSPAAKPIQSHSIIKCCDENIAQFNIWNWIFRPLLKWSFRVWLANAWASSNLKRRSREFNDRLLNKVPLCVNSSVDIA